MRIYANFDKSQSSFIINFDKIENSSSITSISLAPSVPRDSIYPEWHLRDSGLSLCEAFSLPPRAIIDDEANRHSAGAEAVFCGTASLTKASFRRVAVSQKSHNLRLRDLLLFVIRLGFEPKTHSLEGCCSIQLSYRTILILRNEAARMKADCKYT